MTDLIRELLDKYFGVTDGELCVGGLPVGQIVRKYGTPLFIYDAGVLDKKWEILRETLPGEFSVSYSMKANPNPAIIAHLLAKGCGLEIASAGELHLALKAGCSPESILLAGPGKTEEELRVALSQGVGEIHVESSLEAKRVSAISRSLGSRAKIALRVNPSSEAQGGAMRMGGKPLPFGIDEEKLDQVVDEIVSDVFLELNGIHLFSGTQILDADVLIRQYRKGLEIARRAVQRTGRPLRTLDLGGGLGIPYFPGERELNMDRLGRGLPPLVREMRAEPLLKEIRFMVEPGRYLVGEAGVYVTRVNDIKISRGKKFVVVDGGMNHHLAASGNLGQVIKKNFPVAVLTRLEQQNNGKADIAGPLCTPLDVLAREIDIPEVAVGDLIGVFQSGAYARTASPLGFLSYPSPAEVLVQNGRAYLIRRRGTCDDLLNDIPPVL